MNLSDGKKYDDEIQVYNFMKLSLEEIQRQRLKEEKIEHLYDIGRGTSLMNQKFIKEGINFEKVEQIQHF